MHAVFITNGHHSYTLTTLPRCHCSAFATFTLASLMQRPTRAPPCRTAFTAPPTTHSYAILHELQPTNTDYQQHLAHCLYKAGCYDEATFVTAQLPPSEATSKLRAAILYEQNNLKACHQVLEASAADTDVDIAVNLGCLKFREGRYEEARQVGISVCAHHKQAKMTWCICFC